MNPVSDNLGNNSTLPHAGEPASRSNAFSQMAASGSEQRSKPAIQGTTSAPSRRIVVALLMMGLTGALTLLFWKKLQLVTGVPRTAYAVPERTLPGNDKQTPSTAEESHSSATQPR